MASTAMVCKELDPNKFRSGRDFAAYFGGVPRQHSSGEVVRLGRMSRHGDRYLFSLLVVGAHAVLNQLKDDDRSVDAQRQHRWLDRHGRKGAAIRLANHNLRVIWALMRHGTVYQRGRRAKCEVPIPTN
jgi:transposase